MRSVWDNIDDPKFAGRPSQPRLPYLYPGKFLLKVRKIAHYPSAKNPRDEWFRVDFDVVEGGKDGQNAVSWVVNLSKGDMAISDVRAFVTALMGEDTQVNKDLMEQLVGDQQPATGLLVRCEAVSKPTLSGGAFTQTYWASEG